MDRTVLLHPPPKNKNDDDSIKAITQFHPTDRSFKDAIKKNWDLLGTPGTRVIHQSQVTFGHRRPKNLRDHLVSAQVAMPQQPTMFGLRQAPELHGRRPAKRCPDIFTCRYCKHIDTNGTIKSKYDNRSFRTRTQVCCKSNNLIYAIKCKHCAMHYVGETSRNWSERRNEHFLAINNQNLKVPVGHHFSKKNGYAGLRDVTLYALEFMQTKPDDAHKSNRESVERKWQFRLRSNYPLGMNRDDYIPGAKGAKPQTR